MCLASEHAKDLVKGTLAPVPWRISYPRVSTSVLLEGFPPYERPPSRCDCGEVSIPMSMAILSMTPMTVYSYTDALTMPDVRQVRCSIPLTRFWRPQLGSNL